MANQRLVQHVTRFSIGVPASLIYLAFQENKMKATTHGRPVTNMIAALSGPWCGGGFGRPLTSGSQTTSIDAFNYLKPDVPRPGNSDSL
jgi:hypothetical protein